MKRKVLAILALAVVAGAGAAYWWGWRSLPADKVLRLSGHIEATETDLGFKVPGKIAAIHFQEGDWIKAGQVAAQLEDKDLRDDAAQAEARLGAASAALARLQAGSRPQEKREAQAAVAQAAADLENRRLDYQRMQGLLERKAVSVATRDNARTAFRVAQEAVRRAQQNYSLVLEGPRREDIDKARADLSQAQAALDLARTRLGYATLYSPVTGVVLVRSAEPGEVVAVGSPVLTLGNLDNIYFEGYIPETDLAKAKYGQKAVLTTDTYRDKQYPAWVSFISSKPEFTPKTVETFKERVTLVYRTKIRADNPQYELKPGMPAEAVIFLDSPPQP